MNWSIGCSALPQFGERTPLARLGSLRRFHGFNATTCAISGPIAIGSFRLNGDLPFDQFLS